MTRKPFVSGLFYESDKELLVKQIEKSFLSPYGPGAFPTKNGKNVKAIIAPHSGYGFSGACAAFSYKALAESTKKDTFIILGANHKKEGPHFSTTLEDFETPLGKAKIERALSSHLIRTGIIHDSKETHAKEHSIEMQIPFLQYLYKDIQCVPILVKESNYEECKKLAETLFTFTKGKNIGFIVSSDFTHYGYHYMYVPFNVNIKENLYTLDGEALAYITNLETQKFLKFLKEKKTTICGAYAIIVLMEIAKLMKLEGKVLKYYTSGDLNNNYHSSVGYASVVFE